jgi:three-Cys-motif partner protein
VPAQKFGGGWTEQKRQVLDDYLTEYCKIFQLSPRAKYFDTIYIDAFAGTGLIEKRGAAVDRGELFVDFAEPETVEFLKGSASRALQHPFSRYIFIEKSASRITQLEKLRAKSPQKDRVFIQRGDANLRLASFVNSTDCAKCRAVVFLDPYGMQINWQTIEALGRTKAWISGSYFPSVNRSCDCYGEKASLRLNGRNHSIEYLEPMNGIRGFTSLHVKPISSKKKLSRHIGSLMGSRSARS